jgi:iron complex outermembrane receptor protein
MRKLYISVLFVLALLSSYSQQVKLYGKVTDDNNNTPLYNALVTIRETNALAHTDSNGLYQLMVDTGTYTVEFSVEGYITAPYTGVVANGLTDVMLDAKLKKLNGGNAIKTRIHGTVLDDKDNTPLMGVLVIEKGTPYGAQTDSAGRYELALAPGTHSIEFTYLGYGTRNMPVTIYEAKEKQLDIKMTAEGTDLDIIVVTGSKYEKKLSGEVVSMEVLKASTITQSNAKMDEAMNKVPGVNMLGKTISIRGGSGFSDATGNRVLALLDEMPIISPENGSIIWDMVPIEELEQVEVIKGSSSALYGSSALNGVLNMRTVNPKPKMENKVLITYGLYDEPRQKTWDSWWTNEVVNKHGDTLHRVQHPMFGGGSFLHTKQYGDLGVVLSASYQQDQGFRQNNDYKRARFSNKLRYTPHKLAALTVGLNMNFFHQTLKDFFASKGVAYNMYIPSEVAITRQRTFNIDPYINYYDKKENRHSLKFRIFNNLYNSTTGDSTTSTQFFYDYSFLRNFKKIHLVITAGSNGYYSVIQGKTFGDLVADIRKLKTFNTRDIYNVAAYIQVEKKFFEKLTVSGGLRLEYARLVDETVMNRLPLINALASLNKSTKSNIKSPVTPLFRIGLNYQATEGTFIRGSFGQGFRYPSLAEKYIYTLRSGAQVFPNDSLRPENGWSAEIGIKQGVKISNWMAYFDVSGFVMRYHDMIEFQAYTNVPDSINGEKVVKYGIPFQATNITDARIMGVEVSAIANGKIFGVPLNFIIGYSYLDPRNLSYDPTNPNSTKILKYRIQHSFKADIQTTYKGVMAGINMFYNSYMKEIDNVGIGALKVVSDFRRTHNKGDFVMDIRAGYNYKDKFTFNFICKNILNREYMLRPALIEAPRNYTFQIGYNF